MIKEWLAKRHENESSVGFWRCLSEALVGLLILAAVNTLFFKDDPGFISIHPHPFWAIIFLISLRYSIVAAIFPILTLSALYVGLFLYQTDYFYFSSLRIMSDFKEPILFVLLGGFLTESTHRLVRYAQELKARLQLQTAITKDVRLQNDSLTTAIKHLEHRIANQQTSFIRLFKEVSFSRALDSEKIIGHMLEIINNELGARYCCYYEPHAKNLELIQQKMLGDAYDVDIEKDAILMKAFRNKQVAHIAKDISEKEFIENKKNTSIIAAPILSQNKSIIGLVCIRELPFLNFNTEFISLFETVLGWWGDLLDYQNQVALLKNKNQFDDELGVYRYFFFKTRLAEEFHRCKTFALPMVLTLLEIDDVKTINDKAVQRNIIKVLAVALNESKEMLQEIFLYKDAGFAIITPIQTLEDVTALFESFSKKIVALKIKPYQSSRKLLKLSLYHNAFDLSLSSPSEYVKASEKGLKNEAILL